MSIHSTAQPHHIALHRHITLCVAPCDAIPRSCDTAPTVRQPKDTMMLQESGGVECGESTGMSTNPPPPPHPPPLHTQPAHQNSPHLFCRERHDSRQPAKMTHASLHNLEQSLVYKYTSAPSETCLCFPLVPVFLDVLVPLLLLQLLSPHPLHKLQEADHTSRVVPCCHTHSF